MRIFEKIKSFFSCSRKQVPSPSEIQVIYYIRRANFPEDVWAALRCHVQQWRYITHQVLATELTEKISPEYVGIMVIRTEEKVLYRQYLKIQLGCIAIKTVPFQ